MPLLCQALTCILKAAANVRLFKDCRRCKFVSPTSRPTGDYALVLPVAGQGPLGAWLAWRARSTPLPPALDRSRFEGEAFEQFGAVLRRQRNCSAVARRRHRHGVTAESSREARRHRRGKAADFRRKDRGYRPHRARFRRRCRGAGRRLARRFARGATIGIGPSSRTTRSRRLRKSSSSAADAGAAQRYEQRWAPVVEGVSLTRELVTEPANIIYPETFVERVRASLEGSRPRNRRPRPGGDGEARHGRAARRCAGLRSRRPGC